ncbi:DUF4235 domain-containing protein [Micrococcales bacterium 31B]|nr:DUF4235 domain-containing protein [Micrococcales bacterium 31B]
MAKLIVKVLTKFLAPALVGAALKGVNRAWNLGFGHDLPDPKAKKPKKKGKTDAKSAALVDQEGNVLRDEAAETAEEVQRGMIEMVVFAVVSAALVAGVNALIENGAAKALTKRKA